jgi:hypothetical protein
MPLAKALSIVKGQTNVVGEAINPTIQAILKDPTCAEYREAREVMAYSTIREALDIMGVTDSLLAFERYELSWAFGLMDSEAGLVDMLTQAIRTGLDSGIPIIFEWELRKASCSLKTSVVGGKMFITLGTPMLEQSKLPAAFAGVSSVFAGV